MKLPKKITLSSWSLKCESHQSRDVTCQNVWREICITIRIHLLPLHPIPYILDFDASLKHLWLQCTKITREKKRIDFYQTPRICKVQHLSSPVVCRWKDWKREREAALNTGSVWAKIHTFCHLPTWSFSSFFKVQVLVSQSCPALWDRMDCSPPGSSVHEILQARILEWVAMPFSRGSSQPRNLTQVSHIVGRFFTIWSP